MNAQELDVIVRVAGATLLIWAALRLRSDGRPYFVALAICLCGFLAGNTPDPALQLSRPLGSLAVVLTGYAAVFLWWWCLAVFDTRFKPRGLVLGVGGLWIVIASADRGLFGPWLAQIGLSWLLIGLGLIMMGHLAWRVLSDRADDMIDQRRGSRVAVVILLGGQLLVDLCVDLFLGMDWQPQAFSILQNAAFLAFIGWLLRLDLASHSSIAPPQTIPHARSASSADREATIRLRRLMEVDRLYLDPDLTFADVAKAMAASERQVRRLIHQLGYDHFRTFVNAFRVAEAKRRLVDPAHRADKLIAIAFDCGFASLASFNRVFRDMEGRPPSGFRASIPVETSVAPDSGERSARF